MNCAEAREAQALRHKSPDLQAHLSTCPLCTVLDATVSDPKFVGASTWQAVQEQVAMAPVGRWSPKAWPRGWVGAVGALLAVGTMVTTGIVSPAADLPERSINALGLLGIVASLLTITALRWHVRPLYVPPVQPQQRWVLTAAVVGLGVGLAFFPWPVSTAEPAPDMAKVLATSSRCFAVGCCLAVPLLAFLAMAERRLKAPLHRALCALNAAALTGMIALELHCSVPGSLHRLLGHASIAVFAVLLVGVSRWRAA